MISSSATNDITSNDKVENPAASLQLFKESVEKFQDPGYQAKILVASAPYFPEFVENLLIQFQGTSYRKFLGIKIRLALPESPSLPPGEKLLGLNYDSIQSLRLKAEALAEITQHPLGVSKQLEALRTIQIFQNNSYLQAKYLRRVFPHLKRLYLPEALNVVNDIQEPYYRAMAKVDLARRFPELDLFESAREAAFGLAPTPYDIKSAFNEAVQGFQDGRKFGVIVFGTSSKLLELLSSIYKGRVHCIELLSTLAIDMPEILPSIIKSAEQLSRISGNGPLSAQFDNLPELAPDIRNSVRRLENEAIDNTTSRRDILLALSPHLPLRINREVEREIYLGHSITTELYQRSLFLLARSYRDSLQQGTLRNDTAQENDLLNLKDEINALSSLLLMRDLEPPMAVGILGGWGGGKSYIMHLMQAQMTEIRSRPVLQGEAWNEEPSYERLSPYVGHIYQIRFDAWTFAKSDIWASLMQTIFFELDRQISLEQQIAEELTKQDPSKSKAQILCEAGQSWRVLYESDKEERKWLLKKVIADGQRLKILEAQPTRGRLWDIIAKARNEDEQELKKTENLREQAKGEYEAKLKEVQRETSQQFSAILKIQNDERAQWLNALFGTSFILLKRRIGPKLFEELNNQILKELHGTADPIKASFSFNNTLDIPVEMLGNWANANISTNDETAPKTIQTPPDNFLEAPQDYGLWGKLYSQLKELENAKQILEEDIQKQDAQKSSQALDEVASENNTLIDEVAEESSESDAAIFDSNVQDDQRNSEHYEEIEKNRERIETLLQEITSTRFDILNIATTVAERQSWKILLATAIRWTRGNAIPLFLASFFIFVPILLFVWYDFDPSQSAIALTAKLATLIAPIMPAAALLINLLKSSSAWFEESRLALSEYEASIQQKNRNRENRIKTSIENQLAQDKKLDDLKDKYLRLEQQVKDQEALIPEDRYAALADFVTARLEAGEYQQRLGPMHQVQQDLLDLSHRLLPPRHYDPKFKTQVDKLREAFPRGPARVVVYIDDLDRCPPARVVEVLEAVQLLVKTPLFIAVLAIDERYITRALEKEYDGILSRRGRPSGTDYLEKIIQLPYRVRPIMESALEKYLRTQISIQDNASGSAKFSELTRQEFNMLFECCRQVDLSPRTLKRLTNVYKLFKIVCRSRGEKPSPQCQKAILALLALSGRYPDLMRGIFDDIETCFEERRVLQEAEAMRRRKKLDALPLHLQSPLQDFFDCYQLPASVQYLQREFEKLQHDALQTSILPDSLTLENMGHSIFNLIRSFSFVGEIGEEPEDYQFSSMPNISRDRTDHTLEDSLPETNPQSDTKESPHG